MSENELASLVGMMGMGVGLLIYLLMFLFVIAFYIVSVFPYYRMAKRQGLPHAWLVFVPVGNIWVMLNLPRREFNLFNKYIQTDRTKVFWHFLLFTLIAGVLAVPFAFSMVIPVLGWLLYLAYCVAIGVITYGFMWRMYYDIYMTYGMQDNAMLLSILGMFVPIVSIVVAFMIMNREPDFNA